LTEARYLNISKKLSKTYASSVFLEEIEVSLDIWLLFFLILIATEKQA
jgi:hypothetical protein